MKSELGPRRRSSDGLGHADRLSLSKQEAAASLGVSTDSFERHVQPELRVVRRGRLRLFPVTELERWIAENAERPLERWERHGRGSGD